MRCYTQNIDGLEQREGLDTNIGSGKGSRTRFSKKSLAQPRPAISADEGCQVVQLHGDLQTLRCTLCQQLTTWETGSHTPRFLAGRAPRCASCVTTSELRQFSGKRGTKIGTLRPNVVLYGEEHPAADVVGDITAHDLNLAPDLLLVMGTSLHVHGLKTMIREFAKSVHARPHNRGKVVFVNLSRPAESVWKDVFDFWVGMDCDEWIDSTRKCRPDAWQRQVQLNGRITKPKPKAKAEKRYACDDDKENVIPDSEGSELSSVCSPPPKVVIATPRKFSCLPAADFVFTSQSSGKKSKGSSRVIPDSDPASSLPTPPASGPTVTTSPRKRKRAVEGFETELLVTPSKRKLFTVDDKFRPVESPGSRVGGQSGRGGHAWGKSPKRQRTTVQVWEDSG